MVLSAIPEALVIRDARMWCPEGGGRRVFGESSDIAEDERDEGRRKRQ